MFLVIGGTGFCGTHLVHQLLERGEKVRVLSRRGPRGLSLWTQKMLKGSQIIAGDMSDANVVISAMQGVSCVVYAASALKSRNSDAAIMTDIEVNLQATVQLAKLAGEASVKRFVFLSSSGAIYGLGQDKPYDETHACTPISSYGIVKLASENYIRLLGDRYGFEQLFVRLSNPYGPGQTGEDGQGIMAVFISRAMQNKPVKVFGGGTSERDYVFISEAVKAILDLNAKEATGVYNVGSGSSHSVSNVIKHIEHLTNKELSIEHVSSSGVADGGKIRINIDKMRNKIGWAPQTDLDAGLGIHMKWLGEGKKNG